jgi:hypothetical protein
MAFTGHDLPQHSVATSRRSVQSGLRQFNQLLQVNSQHRLYLLH